MNRFALQLRYLWLACARAHLPREMRDMVVNTARKRMFRWETSILRKALKLRYEIAENTTPFRMVLHVAYLIPQLVDVVDNDVEGDLRLRRMVIKPYSFSYSRYKWFWLRIV